MKTISKVSAVVVTLSVAALGSGGGWAWAALACGLAATLALFVACGSLGYFGTVEREDPLAEVVSIESRARYGCAIDPGPLAEKHAGARARAR
jgi:hypothetical protein